MSDKTTTTPPSATTAAALPVGLLALLTVTNALNFVDRNLLASFANFLKPELNLTDTQFGLLTGLVFLVFYAVAGLFMGMLADLSHRPRAADLESKPAGSAVARCPTRHAGR